MLTVFSQCEGDERLHTDAAAQPSSSQQRVPTAKKIIKNHLAVTFWLLAIYRLQYGLEMSLHRFSIHHQCDWKRFGCTERDTFEGVIKAVQKKEDAKR